MGRSLANPAVIVPAVAVASLSGIAYAGHSFFSRSDWRGILKEFVAGPGRTSRLLLVVFAVLNVKSLPFVWTTRIFSAMIRHALFPRKPLPPAALFQYSVTSSRTSLMETDYNLHKSNSTYFADLDSSRTHLVMYLFSTAMDRANRNQETKMVLFPPEDGKPVPGSFGVGLGSVYCSFRREIGPYQPYEMWSRILAWDRKWMYIVTHYVVKGKVKPAKTTLGGSANGNGTAAPADLEKHILATAVSKYVFKVGRFTVHPAILMEASGLLPERPGQGWRGGGPDAVGVLSDLSDEEELDFSAGAAWDWRHSERRRRDGMKLAEHFAALDDASSLFDGGKEGFLGKFWDV